jgi:para-nitrobenzyl esterase
MPGRLGIAVVATLLAPLSPAMADPAGKAPTHADRPGRVARVQLAQAVPSDAARDLAGSWQLVKFQGGDDKVLSSDDRSRYTLAIEPGGSVSVRIDCNRGRGTWHSPGPGQLAFGPLALTRAMCPPAPLTDRLAKDWSYVRGYVIRDGRLFLSLMADAGIYEFERQ